MYRFAREFPREVMENISEMESVSSAARRNHRRWIWLWLLLGTALVVRAGIRDRGVIIDHLEFGRRLLLGLDLYAPYLDPKPLHAPYPPSFGLLTAPFWLLGERIGRFAWVALQVVALGWVGAWLAARLRDARPALARAMPWILLLTLLVGGRYVLRDTHGGGGNSFNLAAAIGAIALAGSGRPRAAGWLLGFALATKPTQVLFVPLLALLGFRRAALHAVLATAAFLLLAFAIHRFDPAPWQRWLEGTLAYLRLPDPFAEPAFGFPPFTWMNQSLRCMAARYLGDVPPPLAAEVPGFIPGLGLAPHLVTTISRALNLALLAVTGLLLWRRRREADIALPATAAVLALSLLLSPISWKAHHVALLPTLFLLSASAIQRRRGAILGLALYTLGCVAGEELTGKELKNLQQSLYLVTLGTLALWLYSLLWRPPTPLAVPPPDR